MTAARRRQDPLAGMRQKIIDGELEKLTWPDGGNGCPVEVGQTFRLRGLSIEITKIQRVQARRKHGQSRRFNWIAYFVRFYPGTDSVHLLKPGSGYTEDPRQAMSAQDDVEEAGTLDGQDPRANPLNIGPPPEPEAVPKEEVSHLPSTVAAKAAFKHTRWRVEQDRRLEQLAGRVRKFQKRVAAVGGDEARRVVDDQIAELEAEMDRVESVRIPEPRLRKVS